MKNIIIAVALLTAVTVIAFAQSWTSASVSFNKHGWGFGFGMAKTPEHGVIYGGNLSLGFNEGNLLGQDYAEDSIMAGGFAGYNFGPVYLDGGLGLGYVGMRPTTDSYWSTGGSKFYEKSKIPFLGDKIANGFALTLPVRAGREFKINRVIIEPSAGLNFQWIWMTATDEAVKNLSSQISYGYTGLAYYDLLKKVTLDQFAVYFMPEVAVGMETFKVSLGLGIPILVKQTFSITGTNGNAYNESGNANTEDLPWTFTIGLAVNL